MKEQSCAAAYSMSACGCYRRRSAGEGSPAAQDLHTDINADMFGNLALPVVCSPGCSPEEWRLEHHPQPRAAEQVNRDGTKQLPSTCCYSQHDIVQLWAPDLKVTHTHTHTHTQRHTLHWKAARSCHAAQKRDLMSKCPRWCKELVAGPWEEAETWGEWCLQATGGGSPCKF